MFWHFFQRNVRKALRIMTVSEVNVQCVIGGGIWSTYLPEEFTSVKFLVSLNSKVVNGLVYGLLKVKGVGQVPGPFHCLGINLNILWLVCQDAVVHSPVQCQYFDALLLQHDITSTVEVMSSLERHFFDYAYSWPMMGWTIGWMIGLG